jgi:hypothetical protein
MPFSEHLPPALVFIFALGAFLLVKLVGYAAAATVLRRAFPDTSTGAWKAGAVRVAVGVAGGLMYVALWNLLYHPHLEPGEEPSAWIHVVWQLGLFATRVGSWWALFALHFPGAVRESKRGWFCALVGGLWSTALDLPAMIALTLTVGLLIGPLTG